MKYADIQGDCFDSVGATLTSMGAVANKHSILIGYTLGLQNSQINNSVAVVGPCLISFDVSIDIYRCIFTSEKRSYTAIIFLPRLKARLVNVTGLHAVQCEK